MSTRELLLDWAFALWCVATAYPFSRLPLERDFGLLGVIAIDMVWLMAPLSVVVAVIDTLIHRSAP